MLCLFFLALAAWAHLPATSLAQSLPIGRIPVEPKHVLVLCSYGYSLPAYQKINPALLAVMENAGIRADALFFEYLDLLHIKDPENRQVLANVLRHKYAAIGIDLIVTLHAPAMIFLLNEAKDLFPNIPTISWNVPEAFEKKDNGRRIFHLVASLDMQGTLQRALELFPQTRRVVFISGVSQVDRWTETEAKHAFAGWHNKLQFEYTTNYSLEEMLVRVADLPPRSIVIYGNVFRDKTGRTFSPRDVGAMVAKTANAPVFGLYDTLLGLGVVGGSLLSFEAEGARVGELARDILNGKISPTELTTAKIGKPVLMFDWQKIERWGGKVRRLPAGSIFINRPALLWEHFGWYVIGFLVFSLGQAFLVASLLIQRARRGRAEEELKEINETLEQRVAERTAELQESEARYRSLFNSMTEGFALHEIITAADGKPCDYRFLEINPAFERLTGLARKATLGKTVREVIPRVEVHWIETYGRVALDGTPIHIENYSASLNRWYEVFAYRSGPRQFAVFFTDITDRKQAEQALRETAEELDKRTRELNAILSSVQDYVYIFDADGRFVFANKKLLDLWGLTAGQAIGKTMYDLNYPKAVAAALLAGVQRVYQTGEVVSNETNYKSPSGVEGFFENILAPMRGNDGQIAFVAGTSRDVTARKRAEKELRRLSQFPEENPNPVLRCSPDGGVLYANVPAMNWMATMGWQTDGPLPIPVQAAVAKARGQHRAIETEITNPAGRTFSIFSIQPPGENHINLYGIDLTDRKQAEQALRESEERIRASLGEKEVLLKEIHHRVKNNMQVVSSLVALHADQLQDGAMRAILLDVTHRVRSMAMVHEQLYQSADLAQVEFAEYTQSLLNYLWRAHGNAACNVRLALDLEPVSLSVNAAVPCGLILNELVSNALKHAFCDCTGGEVAVSLRGGEQGQVCLCVRDNGSGLPTGFDWKQAASLGLRLVQMLAAQLGGTVETGDVRGTEFRVKFPVR